MALDHNHARHDVIITLLDENLTWRVRDAFPVKLEVPQLKASGNEVAIESIEIAHEGLKLEPYNNREVKRVKQESMASDSFDPVNLAIKDAKLKNYWKLRIRMSS